MKIIGPQNPTPAHDAVPALAPLPEGAPRAAHDAAGREASPVEARTAPAPLRPPAPVGTSKRAAESVWRAPPRVAPLRSVDLRLLSSARLRAAVPKRLWGAPQEHVWALFPALPHAPELHAEVPLHAAAYLQRLSDPGFESAPHTPAARARLLAARQMAQAPYQAALDFMVCVLIASKFAGPRAHTPKLRAWLGCFRAALELHRSVVGYDAPLPAIDTDFIFAAESSVGERMGWRFGVPAEELAEAEEGLRGRVAATTALTQLWDFTDHHLPREETFRRLLGRCLVPTEGLL